MKDIARIFSLITLLIMLPMAVLAGDGQGEKEGAESGVELSAEQMALAGVKVAPLTAQVRQFQIYAPGEVLANGYTSYLVSARVESVVLRRHTSLGAHVKKGQPLVTFFSAAVAEAQGAVRLADAEYGRVKRLGRKTVGDKRFIQAQNDFETAKSRLQAFGVSDKSITTNRDKKTRLGEYTLVAAIDGVVLADDFRQGQRVEAGDPLLELANEKELWVEARLAPNSRVVVDSGTAVQVKVAGKHFPARVIQEAHTIDELTRTRVVRLLVNNESHKLHPGQFADVFFSFNTADKVLAVPETALTRGSDGDWQVFVEEGPGRFLPQEVDLGRSLAGFREISGLPEGSRVVMEGAFFVASEMAKSGFDPHDH